MPDATTPTRRIAVVHNLPAGGAKRCLYEIMRMLHGRYAIEVFQLESPGNTFFPLDRFVAAVHEFKTPQPAELKHGVVRKITGDITFYRELRAAYGAIARTVNAGGFDLAFVHHCRFTQSPFVLPQLRVPSVYFCQEPPRALYESPVPRPYDNRGGSAIAGLLRSAKQGTLRRWDRANVAAATVVEVNSEYSGGVIRGIYSINPVVCQLGVDADAFRPLGLSRERMVLSVGSMTPNKSHDLVIEALGRLPADVRPRLVVAGPVDPAVAPEERYLRELAERLGVTLEIARQPDHDALCTLYNRAAMTVYVPRLEPFGLVPLESLACGTPVVAVAEGGVRETIQDGITGLFCERIPASCAAAIERLLADAEFAANIGRAGRDDVRANWTWERSMESVEQGFAEAMRRWHQEGGA